MADYNEAYRLVAKNEGGYSNTAGDTGGETFAGLTRRDWPNWPGWKKIDTFKGQSKFISIVNSSKDLLDSVKQLFKDNYWNPIKGDLISDQQLANQAFDAAINMGVSRAQRWLQASSGVAVDLIIGSGTISAINASKQPEMYNKFLELRKAKYIEIINNDPSQAKFRNSWFSRLTPYKV